MFIHRSGNVKKRIDLNCDLGEGFGPWKVAAINEEELFPLISSANVATGFHAGDPNLMRRTVELAKAHGVGVGAHPGFRDLVGFGRRHIAAGTNELVNDILYQVGALREFTRLMDVPLQHVKPHGALYMHLARDAAMSRALVAALQVVDPEAPLFCMAGSMTHTVAGEMGHPVVCEFYADRDYDKSGSIVFARNVSHLDPARVAEKVVQACVLGTVRTVEGIDISIEFDSVCIHSDTPGALDLIKATREALAARDITINGIGARAHGRS